ncbi:hypothetical protein Gpo141_00009627 [Globisporangium polare]
MAAARMNSSSGRDSNGSSSLDAVGSPSPAPASASLKAWTTDPRDACRWYGGVPCGRPRSCFDCLNVQLPGTDCAVDPGGSCVPISEYEAMLRTPGYNASALAYYPSTNYTYCATSDVACASCHTTWTQSTSLAKGATSNCTGADGCVCIAYCEMANWSKSVLERNSCPSSSSSSSGTAVTSSTTNGDQETGIYKLLMAFGIGLGLCAVFSLIALGVRYGVRILEARSELARLSRRRRRPRREPSGPQLRLSGWKHMLEELIESERVQLGGDAKGAPVLTGTTAAPAAVVVEAGEGYRPMSPSEQHHVAS